VEGDVHVPASLEDEIDELILEFGVRYRGMVEYNGERYLKFEFINHEEILDQDAREIPSKINELLSTAPSESIRRLVQQAKGFIVG